MTNSILGLDVISLMILELTDNKVIDSESDNAERYKIIEAAPLLEKVLLEHNLTAGSPADIYVCALFLHFIGVRKAKYFLGQNWAAKITEEDLLEAFREPMKPHDYQQAPLDFAVKFLDRIAKSKGWVKEASNV